MKLRCGSFVVGAVVSVDNNMEEAILDIGRGRKVVVDVYGHRPVRRGFDTPVLPDVQGAEAVPAPRVGDRLVLVADRRSNLDERLLYGRLWAYKSEFDQVSAVLTGQTPKAA